MGRGRGGAPVPVGVVSLALSLAGGIVQSESVSRERVAGASKMQIDGRVDDASSVRLGRLACRPHAAKLACTRTFVLDVQKIDA